MAEALTLADIAAKSVEEYDMENRVDPASMAEFVKETLQFVVENARNSRNPNRFFEAYQELLRQGIEVKYSRNGFLGRLIHGDRITIVKKLSKPTPRRRQSG